MSNFPMPHLPKEQENRIREYLTKVIQNPMFEKTENGDLKHAVEEDVNAIISQINSLLSQRDQELIEGIEEKCWDERGKNDDYEKLITVATLKTLIKGNQDINN